jgi:hypothetical protein
MVLIDNIIIKEDGVYVSLCECNIYGSTGWEVGKIDELTEIYNEGGKDKLDKHLLAMFFDGTLLPVGLRDSISAFRYVLEGEEGQTLWNNCQEKSRALIHALSLRDATSLNSGSPTNEAKAVRTQILAMSEQLFDDLLAIMRRYEQEHDL